MAARLPEEEGLKGTEVWGLCLQASVPTPHRKGCLEGNVKAISYHMLMEGKSRDLGSNPPVRIHGSGSPEEICPLRAPSFQAVSAFPAVKLARENSKVGDRAQSWYSQLDLCFQVGKYQGGGELLS